MRLNDETLIIKIMENNDELKSVIEVLKIQRARLIMAVEKIDAIIGFENNNKKPVRWKDISIQFICDKGFPQRTHDILEHFMHIYPDCVKSQKMVSALSLALNQMVDNGMFIRMPIKGFKGYFYGPCDWFNSNGKLNPNKLTKLTNYLFDAKIGPSK